MSSGRGLGMKSPTFPVRAAPISKNLRGTEACRAQWAKQAGGASEIARGTGAERVLWTQSARRSVENRKKRWHIATMRVLRVCRDYASFPGAEGDY